MFKRITKLYQLVNGPCDEFNMIQINKVETNNELKSTHNDYN